MKLYRITNYLVLVLMIGVASCQKVENVKSEDKQIIEEIQIGHHHNEAIRYYLTQGPSVLHSSKTQTEEMIDAVNDVLNYCIEQNLITENEIEAYRSQVVVTDYFGWNSGLNDSSVFAFYRQIVSSSIDGEELKKHLNVVIDMTELLEDQSLIISYVNLNIANQNCSSDQEAINAFLDVYTNSILFWNDTDNPIPLLTEGGRASLADGLGALHGFIFGPIGSIIEGTIASIGVHEGWW